MHQHEGIVGSGEERERFTIHHLPLLAQPAPRRFLPPLEDHVVALETARKVVPCGRHEGVFALQRLNPFVGFGLGRGLALVTEEAGFAGKRREQRVCCNAIMVVDMGI